MEIDIVIQQVMEFVGMGFGEQAGTHLCCCVQIVETFLFTSSVQYWESSNEWWCGTLIECRCISALSSIGAFQKCAVYFYPVRKNQGVVGE
jgi:hypothetical protein